MDLKCIKNLDQVRLLENELQNIKYKLLWSNYIGYYNWKKIKTISDVKPNGCIMIASKDQDSENFFMTNPFNDSEGIADFAVDFCCNGNESIQAQSIIHFSKMQLDIKNESKIFYFGLPHIIKCDGKYLSYLLKVGSACQIPIYFFRKALHRLLDVNLIDFENDFSEDDDEDFERFNYHVSLILLYFFGSVDECHSTMVETGLMNLEMLDIRKILYDYLKTLYGIRNFTYYESILKGLKSKQNIKCITNLQHSIKSLQNV